MVWKDKENKTEETYNLIVHQYQMLNGELSKWTEVTVATRQTIILAWKL